MRPIRGVRERYWATEPARDIPAAMKFLLRSGLVEVGTARATLLVVIASIGFGTVPYFTRSLVDDGMPAHAIEFYRFAVTALLLGPALLSRNLDGKALAWGIGAGILLGLGWVGYVHAIETAPVANVGVLYMTFPIFTLLVGWAGFGEKPSRRAVVASLVILVAASLVLGPTAMKLQNVPDLLLALSAPLTFGFMLNVLTRKLTPLPPLARIAILATGAVIGLIPLVLLNDLNVMLPRINSDWWLLLAMALVTFLVPQLLYASFAPVIGSARTSMASSIELPTNFIIAWMAFEEVIGFAHWIAGLLIVGAVVMTPAKSSKISKNTK